MTCEDIWLVIMLYNFILLIAQIMVYKFISKHIAALIIITAVLSVVFTSMFPFLAESIVGCQLYAL